MSAEAQTQRDRFIRETDSTWWELLMGGLAIVFVWLAFANERGSSGSATWWLEWILTIFFIAEFLSRLAASRDRPEHLIEHWVDGISLIPAVRGLRVLRLLRLVRVAAGFQRATLRWKRLERVRTLVNLVIAWLVVMVVGSVTFYAAEFGTNPAVTDFWEALWWGVTTITGGANEILPTTEDGRWAAVILLVAGVALFAALTASVLRILSGEAEDSGIALRQRLAILGDRRTRGTLSEVAFAEEVALLAARGSLAPVTTSEPPAS